MRRLYSSALHSNRCVDAALGMDWNLREGVFQCAEPFLSDVLFGWFSRRKESGPVAFAVKSYAFNAGGVIVGRLDLGMAHELSEGCCRKIVIVDRRDEALERRPGDGAILDIFERADPDGGASREPLESGDRRPKEIAD